MHPASVRFLRLARAAMAGMGLCVATAAQAQSGAVTLEAPAGSVRSALPGDASSSIEIAPLAPEHIRLLDRLTWGATQASARRLALIGPGAFIAEQLKPGPADLPPPVQAAIDAMQISSVPVADTVVSLQEQQDAVYAAPDGPTRERLRQARNERVLLLSREMRQRSLLRMIHSQRQLQEKMTWFWMNHFHIDAEKHDATLPLIVDYEENAVRPNALGRFRDLLAATVYHPAMLLYLDNYENRKGRRNENYARELLELHTLGADGGHQQADVIALSRVLTGLGVNTSRAGGTPRRVPAGYVRRDTFEFDPSRHDNGPKQLLGHAIAGENLAEIDRVITLLARHPSTARHICRKLAVYFVADDPPAELVERLSQVFRDSDGDITATLGALFADEVFQQSLKEGSFKDPMQHVLGAMRIIYGSGDPIVNAQPVANLLSEMGQGLYKRQTPDGYPLERSTWENSAQLLVRFDMARGMAGMLPALFQPFHEKGTPPNRPVPDHARQLYGRLLSNALGETTRRSLAQASSPLEWNTLLLASPEFMRR